MPDIRSQLAPLIVAAGGQSAVSRLSGVAQDKISKYLAGKKDLNVDTLTRLARAVGRELRLTKS